MKRLGTSFGFAEPWEPYTVSPSLLEPYNLNHVSVFLLLVLFACLACLLASLCSPTLAPRKEELRYMLYYILDRFPENAPFDLYRLV